jgi:single-strand DNA-binding protein
MSSFEITGRLIKKYDIESKSASFQTREFVIEIQDGQYPDYVKFQLTQDRCKIIDPYQEGDQIKVSFNLRGRQWQDKYFTNLNAWRVESADGTTAAPGPKQTTTKSPDSGFPPAEPIATAGDDDLPF